MSLLASPPVFFGLLAILAVIIAWGLHPRNLARTGGFTKTYFLDEYDYEREPIPLVFLGKVPDKPWTGEPTMTMASHELDAIYKHLEGLDPETFASATGWTLLASEGPFRVPLKMRVTTREEVIQKINELRESIGDDFTVTVEVMVRMRAELPKAEGEAL